MSDNLDAEFRNHDLHQVVVLSKSITKHDVAISIVNV